MIDDEDSPAGVPLAANDNAAGGNRETTRNHAALVPLVRLLARQAARDWLKQAANDNRPEGSDAERPGKE